MRLFFRVIQRMSRSTYLQVKTKDLMKINSKSKMKKDSTVIR